MYADVTVVVDGAEEQHETFTDYLLLDQFIDGIREDAESDGYHTEVFVLWHEHEMSADECACAQYVTDHHPQHEWNAPA